VTRYRVLIGADDDVGAWVNSRTPNPFPWIPGAGVAIGFTCAERLVAGVTYYGYNGANVWTGIASEEHGWINRRNLALLFDYPFRQLKVRRLSALIDASNTRSQDFVERLGFTREATLVDSATDGDQFVYRMFARDCQWLDVRRKRERQGRQTTGGT
jgi:RimJ/RimL family protein N-acetyltransferase